MGREGWLVATRQRLAGGERRLDIPARARPVLLALGVALIAILALTARTTPAATTVGDPALPTPTAHAAAVALTVPSVLPTATPAPAVQEADEAAPPASAGPLAAITHVVGEGETLSEIAELYGVAADSILWANDGVLNPDFLAVGQELIIPPVSGILHEVLEGDTLLDIAGTYDAEVDEIIVANVMDEPFMIFVGQLLVVPGGRPPEPAPAPQLVAMAEPSRAETSVRGGSQTQPAPPPAPAATVVPHPQLTAQNADFIAQILGPAQRARQVYGVPVSVTIAQAALDTNWGRSGLARRAHNYFGIKARPHPGPAGVVWMDTWEHINGRDVTVKEPFRAYHNMEESVMDYGKFLSTTARYAQAMKHTHDPREFIRLVHRAGFATDPNYTQKIIRLMDRFNLYVYD